MAGKLASVHTLIIRESYQTAYKPFPLVYSPWWHIFWHLKDLSSGLLEPGFPSPSIHCFVQTISERESVTETIQRT